MIQLSNRLLTVANYIPDGAIVADIGSDHGLLPVYLVQSGKSKQVIAGEINLGPLQAAQRQVAAAGLQEQIETRRGNGLEVIQPGEVDTISIAGMGGVLMSEILEAGRLTGKLEGVTTLVLQPNVGEDAVRYWLVKHGYELVAESILKEDGKIYEVLLAERTEQAEEHNAELFSGDSIDLEFPNEIKQKLLYRLGPYLIEHHSSILLEKWESEIKKLHYIASSLEQSNLDTAKMKLANTHQEIKVLKEVLAWLFMDKH